MHTLSITGQKTIEFASCIEEMSRSEFEYMMLLLTKEQAGEITIHDFRVLLTMKLLDIRKTVRYYKMDREQQAVVHDHINRIVDTIDSFYAHEEQEGKLVKRLNLTWITQKLPCVDGLYGPADALTDMTFYEYKEAYNKYMEYISHPAQPDMLLNELIAILYRPRPVLYRLRKILYIGALPSRKPLTPLTDLHGIQARSRKVSRWPVHIKMAIMLWFGNCVEYIRTGRPVIDGNEIDFGILFSKGENTGPSGIGLTGILFAIAESGVFGDVDKAGNRNLYDILVRLYQLQLEYNEIKKNTKHD